MLNKINTFGEKGDFSLVQLCNHLNTIIRLLSCLQYFYFHVDTEPDHMACANLFNSNSEIVYLFAYLNESCSLSAVCGHTPMWTYVCTCACVPVGVRINRGVTKHNRLLICLCGVCEREQQLYKSLVLLSSSVWLWIWIAEERNPLSRLACVCECVRVRSWTH